MTMLVGINFGEYILIAADKGRTQNGKLSSFDEKKITKGQNICITATGYVDIIEKVNSKIINDKVYKIQDVIKIINEEKEKFLKEDQHYTKKEINDQTGFLFVSNSRRGMNLALHYPEWNEYHYRFDKNKKYKKALLMKKGEFTVTLANNGEKVYSEIREIIKKCIKDKRNKEKELEVLKAVFLIMSKNSNQVTEKFDHYFVSLKKFPDNLLDFEYTIN